MKKRLLPYSLSIVVILWISIPQVWSYEEMVVEQGGTIQGKVTLIGDSPKPMAFNLVTIPDPVYCGRISTGTGWRIVEDFIVNPEGGLKDVVVMIAGIKKGKSFELPKVKIEAKDCDFFPFVNVLRDQDEIQVMNMDPVQHDIQGYETARVRGARVLFNRPLPMNPFHKVFDALHSHKHLPGTPMIENIHLTKERDIFVMQCGFHPYMFSWGVVVDNPYYAITKEDGRFEITNVPPGDYTLTAWHAGTKTYLRKNVTVKQKEVITEQFVYEAPKGRRSVHEMHENPHFGLEMLGDDVEIEPSLRLQQTS
ncbi:carboxypeptidase-like regulatory domain-containing protein [Nitrospira sp. M1]